jgi:hypothetical protein
VLLKPYGVGLGFSILNTYTFSRSVYHAPLGENKGGIRG